MTGLCSEFCPEMLNVSVSGSGVLLPWSQRLTSDVSGRIRKLRLASGNLVSMATGIQCRW